jgi:hypothetical protein
LKAIGKDENISSFENGNYLKISPLYSVLEDNRRILY